MQLLHDKAEQEVLNIEDVRCYYYETHPSLTNAAKHNLEILFDEIAKEPQPDLGVQEEILKTCIKNETARQIGQLSVDITDGREPDFSNIENILGKYKAIGVSTIEGPKAITEELEEVLKASEENTKWKFNISSLEKLIHGIGPGSFSIVAARPEVGKTGFWISLAVSQEGWCHQGATVLCLCNEEKAIKNRLRAYQATTGFTQDELLTHKEEATRRYASIKGKLLLYDCVGANFSDIRNLIMDTSPDIVVIDQLDKIRMTKDYDSGHEKFRDIYLTAREMAKEFDKAFIGVSQLSADAHNKMNVDYSMLEYSKTGKAAEADLIICIGASQEQGNFRQLNLSKNKISGNHSSVVVKIQSEVSRYVA